MNLLSPVEMPAFIRWRIDSKLGLKDIYTPDDIIAFKEAIYGEIEPETENIDITK